MDNNVKELISQSEAAFNNRSGLLNLWQEIAENFHVMRADFTSRIIPGDDLTSHLTSSYPLMVHREMTNGVTGMLRPRGQRWLGIETDDDEINEGPGLEFLEWASQRQYMRMYDKRAQLVRATKEGDADFAAFGQTCIYVDRSRAGDHLLYRNYHLRDVAWQENAEGQIDTIYRKFRPTVRDLMFDFGNASPGPHESVRKEYANVTGDKFKKINCLHIMVPTERLNGDTKKAQRDIAFRSYFIDVDNEHCMEETPSRLFKYVCPRWQTVSGSPYAFSPATITGLPDARLIQAMGYTLLDASEKAASPPMIGQADMIKSDLELWSNGVTWVDAEYDEKMGEALRPIQQDYRSLPVGFQMQQQTQEMLAQAFFLNKIRMPMMDKEMTAYETAQHIEQYLREALPLFEPMEHEYNGALAEMTFETMKEGYEFGPPAEMPEEIQGQNIRFKFFSPLQEKEERKNSQTYLEVKALIAEALALDENMRHMVDGRQALRDAIRGTGAPADWTVDDPTMDELIQGDQAQREQQQMLDQAQQGSEIVEKLGNASANMGEMQGTDAL